LVPGGLQVVVTESREGGAYVIYILDKDLAVNYVEVSSGFKALHRRLEQAGRLKHPFSAVEVTKLSHVRVVRGH
jgi:phage FluMu protein gp41